MSQLPKTRHSLLIRLRGKSNDAWKEFLEIYEQAIYRFSRSRGLQDADAWDVTQEVLSAVEKKIETWQLDPQKDRFRGWLFRVARNIAVDKVVAQSKRAAASGDSRVANMLAELPETTEQQSTVFQMEYRRTLLDWAGQQIQPEFNEKSWQSFLLTAVDGKSAAEVSKVLGMSAGSIYAAKFRIMSRIKKLVAQFDETGDVEEALLRELKNDNQ